MIRNLKIISGSLHLKHHQKSHIRYGTTSKTSSHLSMVSTYQLFYNVDLGKYYKFFKLLLKEVLQQCVSQNVFVVELRHIFGMLFDDDRNLIGLEKELELIQEIVNDIKKDYPYFELSLIITGLKIVGKSHIVKMITQIIEGKKYSDLIAGFDMVNEEDVTPPILEFL